VALQVPIRGKRTPSLPRPLFHWMLLCATGSPVWPEWMGSWPISWCFAFAISIGHDAAGLMHGILRGSTLHAVCRPSAHTSLRGGAASRCKSGCDRNSAGGEVALNTFVGIVTLSSAAHSRPHRWYRGTTGPCR